MKTLTITIKFGEQMTSALTDNRIFWHRKTGVWLNHDEIVKTLTWAGMKCFKMAHPEMPEPPDASGS